MAFGALRIRIRIITEDSGMRQRGTQLIVRTVHCEEEAAQGELRKFIKLNPHFAGTEYRADWTRTEQIYLD